MTYTISKDNFNLTIISEKNYVTLDDKLGQHGRIGKIRIQLEDKEITRVVYNDYGYTSINDEHSYIKVDDERIFFNK